MADVPLTDALRREYQTLFDGCLIQPDRQPDVEKQVRAILLRQPRYEAVTAQLGIPWHFVACVHSMEANLSFACHLHNGDPLTALTKHDPKGRPKPGAPPFTWEQSACDALALRHVNDATDWSLAGTLYELEGYNGWGYRLYHPDVKSPYLWSYSNQYRSGKYVKDGTWSSTAVSRQCGAAVLLRRLAESGAVEFPDQPLPEPADAPLVRFMARKPTDIVAMARAEDLQRWLNTFPGVFVKVDGWTGTRSSDAMHQVTGHYLPGDPRA